MFALQKLLVLQYLYYNLNNVINVKNPLLGDSLCWADCVCALFDLELEFDLWYMWPGEKFLPLLDLAACPGWMLGLASSVNAEEIMICRVLWLDSTLGLTSLEVGLVSTCLSIIVGLTLAGW